MGYDATCTLTFEGREARGTAWLEHKDLVFRGPTRLAIALKDITEARADGGTLHVRFGGKRAQFEIGESAAKWATRITNPPSRLDKLGIKPGMRVALVGVRDEQFEAELAARGADLSYRLPAPLTVDALFYAANTRTDLVRFEAVSRAIKPGGAVWVLRPKGKPDITEAETMAAGKKAGLVDVKVVSFSESLSAEKYMMRRGVSPARTTSKKVIAAAKRVPVRRSSTP